MKKIIATLTAIAAAMTMSVFAEKYISANDLEKVTLTADLACEDNFVIHATEEKSVEIGKQSQDTPCEANGETFTQRIKLPGSGKLTHRSIEFPAKAGQKVTIIAKSSSKTDSRVLLVQNAAGATIGQAAAPAYPDQLAPETIQIPEDGQYFVLSKKDAIYVYCISVE